MDIYIWMNGIWKKGETRAYGTRFSIRSINSTHRNQGGEEGGGAFGIQGRNSKAADEYPR